MKGSLIPSVLFFGIIFLSACSTPEVEKIIVTETKVVQRPAPIVPSPDVLNLRTVNWMIVTPENVDELFESYSSDDLVLFGITTEGYEDLALNLSDLRAYIQQQNEIIAIYKSSYR